MNIYYVEHAGHYLGGYSVVVARDKGHAKRLLSKDLPCWGIDADAVEKAEFTLIDPERASATVLFNGDY